MRDRLVHQRLGEGRLVALVVAMAAIAEHVDDHRLLEFLPELGRDLGREHHRFRIVAVHMENRRLDHLGDIGRIRRRARIARISGEADLIVDDEVHRAAGAVTAQPGKPETFRDHALPGERGVAVDQERHHHGAIVRRGAVLILLGAHLAEHDRIDDFQMRRIGGQRQVHLVAVELAVRRGAEMILHVAGALDLVRRRGAALEFVEDRAVRLAHDLRQHIEPAAMRPCRSRSPCTPSAPPRLMICSSAGIIDSAPSSPKRLVPVNFTSQNFSKPSASTSLLRIARLPSRVKVISLSGPSMRS